MRTERTKLASNKHHRKQVDLEWVYKKLDEGRTIKSVADELEISVSTLRRRHSEYQAKIKEERCMKKEMDWIETESLEENEYGGNTFEF